ncbi:MAG: hypothetical protein COA52_02200 [Hyphomicrobiales bacterium]|nr:MAG: hypothetical protein COA52_02200 [Hyphomicrobiales bacterium]
MTAVEFGQSRLDKIVGSYQGASFTKIAKPLGRRTDNSNSAKWARQIAPMGFAVTVLGALLHRIGFIPVAEMLAVLGAGCLLSLLSFGLSLNSFMEVWRTGVQGGMRAASAMAISLFTLIPFFMVVVAVLYMPRVNGATTTTIGPPIMLADIAYGRDINAVLPAYQEASPDLVTKEFKLAPAEVYKLAKIVALREGYKIGAELPPVVIVAESGDGEGEGEGEGESRIILVKVLPIPKLKPIVLGDGSVLRRNVVKLYTEAGNTGIFEATSTTPVLGFVDDVVVRVVATNDGSAVDMRSTSRLGGHDLGTNSRRVRTYLRELDLAVKATLTQ